MAQGVFSFFPNNPNAGDEINITYSLPDSIKHIPEAFIVKYNLRENLFDLLLKKKGNLYTATIKTDTSNNLLIFSFKNAGK